MTPACEDARNLSLSYQLLSVLTTMLLALEHFKSHVLDAGGREQGQGGEGSSCQKVLAISGYFKKKFHFIKGFVTPPTSSEGRGYGGAVGGVRVS